MDNNIKASIIGLIVFVVSTVMLVNNWDNDQLKFIFSIPTLVSFAFAISSIVKFLKK